MLDVDISLRGGTLTRVDLPAYPQVKGQTAPVRLENHDAPLTLYELQTGLTGPGAGPYPDQNAQYTSDSADYRLGSAAELRVPLTWSAEGVTVTKTYTFRRGAYGDRGFATRCTTAAAATMRRARSPRSCATTRRPSAPISTSTATPTTGRRSMTAPSTASSTRPTATTCIWRSKCAMAGSRRCSTTSSVRSCRRRARPGCSRSPWPGNQYLLGGVGPAQSLAPGASAQFAQTLFVGPKLQNQLEAIAPELGRVADYGRLWFLARPLFWLLAKVHALTGNWGIAIILVTFLLKLLFYPLSEASGRSMAKMKTLQPRIKNLQETYKDDREKLGRAMMELYQREKINPVAGCLPIVIQIPVFIAFYWVLLESVEMRQAPFMGWIHDLSSRDPLFILPLIMAVAMFLQYKLNPTPPDPVQAKVFMFMPLVMSCMFAFFPAGLVLYWVTNTVLSIAQQWNINRRIEAVAAAKRAN